MPNLSFELVRDAISGSACAFRSRTRLQPADGPGGKVFPPTHLEGKYALEERVLQTVDGEPKRVQCCLLYTSPSPRDLSTSRMPSSA